MSKVRTAISGGLGNQMFQYAAGRALAHRLGVPLELDVSCFLQRAGHADRTFEQIRRWGSIRCYELGAFELPADTFQFMSAWMERLITFLGRHAQRVANTKVAAWHTRYGRCQRKLWRHELRCYKMRSMLMLIDCNYYLEPTHNYVEAFDHLKAPIHIEGYWQSERYFKDTPAEPLIRQELSLARFRKASNQALCEQTAMPDTVSIHFRRGDNHVSRWLTPLSYYVRAVRLLRRLVGDGVRLRYFVFSDDTEELRPLLAEALPDMGDDFVMVSDQGLTHYEELMLMSGTQHHIMANSSFSWWGTWLHDRNNDNRPGEKYVLAPRAWYPAGPESKLPTKDLYCEGWIII